jgi:hypothetical protein
VRERLAAAAAGLSIVAISLGELTLQGGVATGDPNGDETHCFAVCLLANSWRGEPHPDHEETMRIEFADPASPPSPIHGPTAHALELLNAYLRSGRFQLR